MPLDENSIHYMLSCSMFIADLHIHSKYSRATSKLMCPEGLERWAQLKGIQIIGTGDFTHPEWIKELQEKLEPAAPGLYRLKDEYKDRDVPESCRDDVLFMLSAEVSSIYSKGGKNRAGNCPEVGEGGPHDFFVEQEHGHQIDA